MMNLPEGTKSSFEDILKNFYKDDIKKIQKYVSLLRDEGVSFDDEFILKSGNKFLRLAGSRINGLDGNVYCDMIWFRDVSYETNKIARLEEEKEKTSARLVQLEDLIDNIPFPIWLRDDKLKLVSCNKKYLEFTESKNRETVINEGIEISGVNGENVSQNLALLAHTTNRVKKNTDVYKRQFIDIGNNVFLNLFQKVVGLFVPFIFGMKFVNGVFDRDFQKLLAQIIGFLALFIFPLRQILSGVFNFLLHLVRCV